MSTPPDLPVVPDPSEPAPSRASDRGLIFGTTFAALSVLFLVAGGTFLITRDAANPTPAALAASQSPSPTCDGYTVDTSTGAVVCATPGSGATTNTPAPAAASTAPSAPSPTTAAPSPPAPAPPKDQVFSGRGDKVIRLKLSPDYASTATITHSGSSNFAVMSLDDRGDQLDLLVNEIGRYSGVRPLDFVDTPAALKINADGSWKVTVRALGKAPIWPGASASGKGAMVMRVDPAAVGGLATVKVTHSGSSNFVVHAYGSTAELLINEIGRYSGEVLLPGDTAALVIEADGAWTVKLA